MLQLTVSEWVGLVERYGEFAWLISWKWLHQEVLPQGDCGDSSNFL